VMMLFVMLLAATDSVSAESCIYISDSPWLNQMLLQYSCAGVFEFLFHVSISKWMVDLVMNANLRLCLRVALFLLVLFCHE